MSVYLAFTTRQYLRGWYYLSQQIFLPLKLALRHWCISPLCATCHGSLWHIYTSSIFCWSTMMYAHPFVSKFLFTNVDLPQAGLPTQMIISWSAASNPGIFSCSSSNKNKILYYPTWQIKWIFIFGLRNDFWWVNSIPKYLVHINISSIYNQPERLLPCSEEKQPHPRSILQAWKKEAPHCVRRHWSRSENSQRFR